MMIAGVTKVFVEASEAWPVVAGSLGAAGIVAAITLWVAHLQRGSDKASLTKQLDHDREMRREELVAASERLDRQLAQDRELREQELAHDRQMRDLQLMRETLAPIIALTLDWNAFTALHQRLKADDEQPIGTETWASDIVPLVNKVGDVSESLRRGSRTLVILAGPEASVALKLKEVANGGDTLVHLASLRAHEGRTTPAIQASLDGTWLKYADDHARFIEAANEAVRWGEAESDSTKPSAG
jgi:hypothetical protein